MAAPTHAAPRDVGRRGPALAAEVRPGPCSRLSVKRAQGRGFSPWSRNGASAQTQGEPREAGSLTSRSFRCQRRKSPRQSAADKGGPWRAWNRVPERTTPERTPAERPSERRPPGTEDPVPRQIGTPKWASPGREDQTPSIEISRQGVIPPPQRTPQAEEIPPPPMQRGPLCPGRKEPQSGPPGKEDPSPRRGDLQQRWRP